MLPSRRGRLLEVQPPVPSRWRRIEVATGAAVAALLLASPIDRGPAVAASFEIACQILDPVTGRPRAAFAPGDDVMLRLRLDVAAEAAERKMVVTASARVKLLGRKFWAELGDGKLRVPNAANRAGIEGLEGIEAKIPEGILLEEVRIVRLPDKLPRGQVTLRAEAALDGFGKESCRQDVRVD